MEIFYFFRGLLAWMATVGIFLPLSIPMAAAAYKVRNGAKPLDIESDELWYRAFLAAFVFALVSVGFILLDWFITDNFDFPAGMIHLVVVMGYIPMGAWVMTYFFGFSDLMDGLSTFTIFMGLPLFVLWLINLPTGLWDWALKLVDPWLKAIEVTRT
jgi:hypothetical protein